MTTLLILGIIIPVLILGALCVWLAVRLQRAEREMEAWRARCCHHGTHAWRITDYWMEKR